MKAKRARNEDEMPHFTGLQWCIVIFCAVTIGFSKTGILGVGILFVPLMAMVLPARESTGFILPMLAMADVIAIVYWRRHVNWGQMVRLMPWTIIGMGLGYICMGRITDQQLMPIIGGIILGIIALAGWQNSRSGLEHKIPTQWYFAAFMGIITGLISMLANAAGPVMTIYLLAMRLGKKEFVGTAAWFFWIVNLLKIPLASKLNLVTWDSLGTNFALLPCIVLGTVLGILLIHRIPQRAFNITVTVLAAISAVYLCVRPLFSLR
jgi:uncharacterized protein